MVHHNWLVYWIMIEEQCDIIEDVEGMLWDAFEGPKNPLAASQCNCEWINENGFAPFNKGKWGLLANLHVLLNLWLD